MSIKQPKTLLSLSREWDQKSSLWFTILLGCISERLIGQIPDAELKMWSSELLQAIKCTAINNNYYKCLNFPNDCTVLDSCTG